MHFIWVSYLVCVFFSLIERFSMQIGTIKHWKINGRRNRSSMIFHSNSVCVSTKYNCAITKRKIREKKSLTTEITLERPTEEKRKKNLKKQIKKKQFIRKNCVNKFDCDNKEQDLAVCLYYFARVRE